MIASIHQPQYMPYIGYFYKIIKSDIFVFLDDAQFKKNEWQNRNRIKGANGLIWLTVPVSFKFGDKINEVKISDNFWKKKHINSIKSAYSKSPYFEDLFGYIEDFFRKDYEYLSDLNIKCVKMILKYMDIDKRMEISSSLNINLSKTERLVKICEMVKADEYLSGDGGKDYLDENLFKLNKIKLRYLNYKPLKYDQLWGEFAENLSILDMLFNLGPRKTRELLSL